jgi:hypothetical protein
MYDDKLAFRGHQVPTESDETPSVSSDVMSDDISRHYNGDLNPVSSEYEAIFDPSYKGQFKPELKCC